MSWLSLLTSCALNPPDVPLCTEITPSRGYCVNTISSKEYEINDTQKFEGKTWWELKPYLIKMPAQSWVEIKKFIKKTCKKYKCGKKISNWQTTVGKIDKKVINKPL